MPRLLVKDEHWSKNTTKIHMAVDAFGLPIHFEITGGQVHEFKIAPQLVMELKGVEYIVGDKGYDSEARRIQIVDQGASACLYKYRHLVENAFARLKHFRSVATRLEKLKRNYEGMVALGCAIMWLPL